MNRYIDLNHISDGKLYRADDLVKAGCGDCLGCSKCCESMADTIILDPMDLYLLTANLHTSAASLMHRQIDLGVVDGIVLPHIKMADDTGRCPFLTEAGVPSTISAPASAACFLWDGITKTGPFATFFRLKNVSVRTGPR